MTTQKHRVKAMLDVTAEIVRTNPDAQIYDVTSTVQELAKLAKSLHKRYENSCNYAWACGDAYESRTGKLEERSQELGAKIGVTIGHQRDPRGWPLIIRSGTYETRLG